MTIAQLATMTRRQIVAYAVAQGIPNLHLTHYRKDVLVAYVAGELAKLGKEAA